MPADKKNTPTLLIGLSVTLWLVITLVGYYYTHKPFTAEFITGAVLMLWRMIACVGIISIAGGIGAWILSNRVIFPAVTGIAVQAALGSGILGLTVFLMGVTVGFRTLYFVILLLAISLFTWKHILNWFHQWVQIKTLFSKNGFVIALALGTGPVLLWALATALAPPLHFDALTYHLALPRLYLLAGNMVYTPDNVFWGMPQQIEMLYTLAMALGGAEAATILGWGLGVLTLLGLLGYIKEKINLRAGWVAVACLLGGRSLAISLAWGYTEWPVMWYGLGMIVALDMWRDSSKRSYLLLAAALAGFALGSKYTAGQLLLIGLVIIAWEGFRKHDRRTLANLVLFGALAALLSVPWWIKNWLATSNPFYPLLFPSGAMSQARLEYYSGSIWGSWLDMLILPWQVTVWGMEGREGFSWSIGPLLLGFGTIFWVGWQARRAEEKRLISTAVIATVSGFIIWAIASRLNGLLIQSRLYLVFFPAWAILGGIGFDSLTNLRAAGIRFGRIGAAVLLMVFTFNLFELAGDVSQKSPFAVMSGSMSPASYRTRNLGSYTQAMTALGELPPDARVLMLWETRNLVCLPKCDPDEIIDRWYDESTKHTSTEDTLAAWRTQGYTHLLIYVTGMNFVEETDSRITPASWDKLNLLLDSLPDPKIIAPGYELYELTEN